MNPSCETDLHDHRPIESGKISYMLHLFYINSCVAWRLLIIVFEWGAIYFNDVLQCKSFLSFL